MGFALRFSDVGQAPRQRRGRGRPTFSSVGQALRDIVLLSPRRVAAAGEQRMVFSGLDLEIAKGEIVCFTGADERTPELILRMLALGSVPSAGRIEIDGRVAGSLGAGDRLDDEASAAENIVRERQYLPTDPKESDEAFVRKVIAFAGLEGFEDVPVRRYSTGMELRLTVALLLMSEASILVFGDMLGVADAAFQARFIARVKELARRGVTTLILGPVMARRNFATRVIGFANGAVVSDLRPADLVEAPKVRGSHLWTVKRSEAAGRAVSLLDLSVEERSSGVLAVAMDFAFAMPQRVVPALDFRIGPRTVMRTAGEPIDVAGPTTLRAIVIVPDRLLGFRECVVDVSCLSETDDRTRDFTVRGAIAVKLRVAETPGGRRGRNPLLRPSFEWKVEDLAEVPA